MKRLVFMAALLAAIGVGTACAQGQQEGAAGRGPEVTVRAVRLDAPIELDGRLDEPLYASAPMPDLVQYEPSTEVRPRSAPRSG